MTYVDLDFEPIDPDLRDCIAEELARLPGSRLVKRRGRLFFQGLNGFEIRAEVLCAAKARWAKLQHSGAITDEQIWDFLVLLIAGDVRLRDIPNGISLDLPPSSWTTHRRDLRTNLMAIRRPWHETVYTTASATRRGRQQ